MRRARAFVVTALALALGSAAGAASADPSAPVRIVDLRVEGGEGWRAQETFRLRWELDGAGPVATIHCRVRRSEDGAVVTERQIPGAAGTIKGLNLRQNGVYLAEVWAEDTLGLAGPVATARLRLDRARPGDVALLLPSGWIAGSRAVHLHLSHPAEPLPLSGIRGYAVSIDDDPSGTPCTSAEGCEEKEVDLANGIEGDLLSLPGLQEGRLYVHAVAVSGSGMHSERVATAVAHVDATPPRVAFEGTPAGWVNGPVAIRARAADALSGVDAADPDGPFTAISVDGGPLTAGRGASVATVIGGDGVHRLTAFARDAAGNVGNPNSTVATVRIDTVPPRVAFANGHDPGDPDRIEATIEDGSSGAAGRGSIGFRPARSHQRFQPLPTAAAAGRLTARWDPTSHPAGTYELQATGYDLAGNVATGTARANGARMLIVNPRRAATRIEARLGPPGATTSAGTPHSRELGGTLRTVNGTPLAGREVEMIETFAAGALAPARRTTVRTDRDGRFSVRLAPGPSRRVELSFAGERSLAPATAVPLSLTVPARVTLRASSRWARVGGRPIVFRGRVGSRGAALPPHGIPVELQFRLPGLKWSEFRTVTTDRQGRFRYPYAFADNDSRAARFQFRAVVPERESWPYAAGASRPVSVTGR